MLCFIGAKMLIGKWHLGMNWDVSPEAKKSDTPLPIGTAAADGPTTRGFDYFCGFTHSRNIGMVIEQDRVLTNVAPVEVQPLLARKTVTCLLVKSGIRCTDR